MYHLNFNAIRPYLANIPDAVGTTLALSVVVIVASVVVGAAGAVFRARGPWWVRTLLGVYVEVMRNIPVLVILYVVYFALPQLGLRFSGFNAAAIALTLNAGAYMVEIFRSGLIAIPRGQFEAANSQGMTAVQLYRHVVLPQVLEMVYAPLGNQVIAIVIGTSLASLVTVTDVTAWMEEAGASSFRYFEAFLITGGIYLVLCQSINLARLMVGRRIFRQHRQARR
jgi:His/Glu/Gln/Arg/opine family amino acid ABC transporter permease subunit